MSLTQPVTLSRDTEPDPPILCTAGDGVGRYSLLAGALAGRRLTVAAGEGLPYTDGHTVYVSDEADDRLLAVILHASLLGAGSLEERIVAKLVGSRGVAQRYFSLEVARAGQEHGRTLPRFAADLVAGHGRRMAIPRSPDESLDRARGREEVPLLPDSLGVIRGREILRAATGSGPKGGANRGDKLGGLGKDLPIPEAEDEEETERSRILEIMSSPLEGAEFLSRLFRDILGVKRRPKPDTSAGGGTEMPVAGVVAVKDVGPKARLVPGVFPAKYEPPAGVVDGVYPEWDWTRRRYRKDWCWVGEFEPPAATTERPVVPVRDFELRRKLARLGLALERHRRQPEGEALDFEALVDYVVAREAGASVDDRVYESRRKSAHDLGVLILLDVSGSTGEKRPDGTRIHDDQTLLVANLAATLEDLGDRAALFGFNSYGRKAVRLLHVKDFEDRFEQAALRRLASITPGGYTRLGAAVRHGAHLLATKAGTTNRLLVVVSDGLPYDDGYREEYAERDTRQALAEARQSGVGSVCLSIGTTTDDAALERVFGTSAYARLSDVADMNSQVDPLFRAALRAVSTTKRKEKSL